MIINFKIEEPSIIIMIKSKLDYILNYNDL